MAEPIAADSIPDRVGYVVGYRGWNLYNVHYIKIPFVDPTPYEQLEGDPLWSLTRKTTWYPNQIKEAKCGGNEPVYWRIKLNDNYPELQDWKKTLTQEELNAFYKAVYLPEYPELFKNKPLPKGISFLQNHLHSAPDEKCACGIYALNTLKAVSDYCRFNVFGKVACWGKIVEGENGIRAQYCYPLEFYIHDGNEYEMPEEWMLQADWVVEAKSKRLERIYERLKKWNLPIKLFKE